MSSRRRRRRGGWPLLAVLLAAVATWWFWPGSTEPETPPTEAVTTREATVTPEITIEPRDRQDEDRTPTATDPASTSEETGPRLAETERRQPPSEGRDGGTPRNEPATDPVPRGERPVGDGDGGGRGTSAVADLVEASRLSMDDRPVDARRRLSEAWIAGLDGEHRAAATDLSVRLARRTLLEEPGRAGSPWVRGHRVAPGESIGLIRQREGVKVGTDFLARINGLSNPDRVRAGDTLWLPEGSFHVQVDLTHRDLAVFQETGEGRHLLLVVPVGIGRNDTTPPGLFRIKPGSRSRRPSWTSPDGRRFAGDDPENPLGGWWIGLEALQEEARQDPRFAGLGVHGTIEPETVGTACTNGSLRVTSEDAALLYELLDTRSTVDVRR